MRGLQTKNVHLGTRFQLHLHIFKDFRYQFRERPHVLLDTYCCDAADAALQLDTYFAVAVMQLMQLYNWARIENDLAAADAAKTRKKTLWPPQ